MVRQKTLEPKLGRQDWIKTGLAVLAESGVEAVRVEPIAKRMNVTKGSFYWHFKDRNDLLDAILAEWVQIDTSRIIEQVNQTDAEPKTKLLRLFELAIADDGLILGLSDGRIENAIRAWATNDTKVAAVLAQVDRQRLDYTKSLFVEIGFSEPESLTRARLAYYSLVGEFAIGVRTNQVDRLAEIRLQHTILTTFIHE
ncbi:TetR/AcrR family transcriptional regulator [Pseudanabaena sp. FACHB-2040]|uniref:TetR/AcrR family transcriptional regulator n=1 Tax=Pseudanabaena sp. FACHB-2040 TaxID=2692859 RepID=UPI0016824E81|nr:TetR/AcrR family transcriptional regulator [Pseudanabaena sp. FACHB-2040]MBD2260334.1 TetR/AcrR family transcriptional regulator [Pseudanabaena sp. FACHB-2040]